MLWRAWRVLKFSEVRAYAENDGDRRLPFAPYVVQDFSK